MSIQIGWFSFEGPFADIDQVSEQQGLFAVLTKEGEKAFTLLDVDMGESVRSAIETHPRRACWRDNSWGTLHYAVWYPSGMNEADRLKAVTEIRMQYTMACGEDVKSKPYGEPKPWKK